MQGAEVEPEADHFLPEGGDQLRELEVDQGLFHQADKERYSKDLEVGRIHLNVQSIPHINLDLQ